MAVQAGHRYVQSIQMVVQVGHRYVQSIQMVVQAALLQPTVKADIEVKNVEFMRLLTSGCKEITVQSYGVSG